MNPTRTCPDCGAALPDDAPRGLCPACLMGAALSRTAANGPGARAEVTVAFEPSARSAPGAAGSLAALAETLGGIPRVLLRDTEAGPDGDPIVQPGSAEMPGPDGRSAHLQLLGEIARGGMGAVLKGRDAELGRDLAVKVLLEKHRDQPSLIRRFVEEAQIAGQLQHPGIVPVYELGAFADRRPYFTMKLVRGRTLATVLADRGDPDEDRMALLATLLQVGQTVAYAHARGVIHRDLKPSNVMVGSFGEVQVMDWGLAKVLARGGTADDAAAGRAEEPESIVATARSGSGVDLSQPGSVLGTPAYMAPEQARGELDRVDERADVFALGSILCEVLTGQPAFTGGSSAEIMHQAACGDLADTLGRLESCGADAELVTLARDCLAPGRDDRPRDASAFADRLAGYLASIERRLRDAELQRAAEAARAEEAQARVAVERSRRRRTAALAASLLALLSLGGLTSAYVLRQHRARLAEADRNLGGVEALLRRAHDRAEDPAGWRAALAALQQIDPGTLPAAARPRLEALARDIRAGAAAAEADQDLLARLLDIRSLGAESSNGDAPMTPDTPDSSIPDGAYARTFRAAGYDVDALGPEAVGAAIRGRPGSVALGLAAALDDWATQRRRARPKDEAAWRRLAAAARVADPDPRRVELRTLWERTDRGAQLEPLRAMARKADVDAWPAPTLKLLAGALAEAGDRGAAVALLRRAVARHASDVGINYDLARLLSYSRDGLERAIPYYMAARALRPETAHVLAHAILERDGFVRSEEALGIFRDLSRLRPEESRHLVCLGQALGMAGRADESRAAYESAISAARAAIRRDPGDARAHFELGIALQTSTYAMIPRGGRFAMRQHLAGGQARRVEAFAEMRAAIRLQPDFALAHLELGKALAEDAPDRQEEAIAELREAVRLLPNHGLAYARLGQKLAQRGRYEEAVAALREAVRCNPDLGAAHESLGRVLIHAGQFDRAILEYREAARLAPDRARAEVQYGLARLLLRQGKPDEAVAQFRGALRLEPRLPHARTGCYGEIDPAILTLNRGGTGPHPTPDETIAAYRAAIRLHPDDPEPYIILGQALESLQRPDEAIAAFREAIARRPDFALARVNLVRVLQAQGQLDEAIAENREVLRLDPDDVRSHVNHSQLLSARGDFAEALRELRKAQELMPREKVPPPNFSVDLVRRTEMMVALAARLPPILAGRDRPKDNAERLTLGLVCSRTGRHAAAARLWGEAMEADPKLADNLRDAVRLYAAVAAARAGCGQGEDAPPPDDSARVRWRRKALAWLRSDLVLWTRQLASAPAEVGHTLSRWKSDPGLAGVRDPKALDGLPEAERAGWRALWADVDRLLDEARKAKSPQ